MYSYENQLRAMQLYIKLGKQVGLTTRQLGSPTKNLLKSWHRENFNITDSVGDGRLRQWGVLQCAAEGTDGGAHRGDDENFSLRHGV